MALAVVSGICSARSAFADRDIFFRNDLTTAVILTLRSPQNPAGTSRRLEVGESVGFELITDGRFTIAVKSLDDGVTFVRQGVDLQTVLDGIGQNNTVSMQGIFDCELGFDAEGGIVVERRLGVTFTFRLQFDPKPFTITATPNGPVFSRWRCLSMPRPARPQIYNQNPQFGVPNAAPAPPPA
jgi:hypothetical protein